MEYIRNPSFFLSFVLWVNVGRIINIGIAFLCKKHIVITKKKQTITVEHLTNEGNE